MARETFPDNGNQRGSAFRKCIALGLTPVDPSPPSHPARPDSALPYRLHFFHQKCFRRPASARLLRRAGVFYIPAATMKIHRADLRKYFHYGSSRCFIFHRRPSRSSYPCPFYRPVSSSLRPSTRAAGKCSSTIDITSLLINAAAYRDIIWDDLFQVLKLIFGQSCSRVVGERKGQERGREKRGGGRLYEIYRLRNRIIDEIVYLQ